MMSEKSTKKTKKDNVMELGYWSNRWKTGDVQFHKEDVHYDLIENENKLLPQQGSVFFPLCGKTVDMAYLASKGHTVVGLEFDEEPIKSFFSENKLKYNITEIEDYPFKKYQCCNQGADITIYQGDINHATVNFLGKFDAIWDRGSFVAINTNDRTMYTNLILGIMKPNTQYYLLCVEFDSSVFGGPPHSTTQADVQKHFGKHCHVTPLKRSNIMSQRYQSFGLREGFSVLYNLTLK
uniref:thiopurine S-methyltransferase n=1 Tax=Phallusia mammillata TaxID=59560 RepID=A0A6F9DVJ3_9ASCI|nr:thiopurine S-methyltransferase-like [Phallusia mammillata]